MLTIFSYTTSHYAFAVETVKQNWLNPFSDSTRFNYCPVSGQCEVYSAKKSLTAKAAIQAVKPGRQGAGEKNCEAITEYL